MSYCVNCGVKLKKSEKKCPLCNTKIINPNKIVDDYEPIYPNKIEELQKINFKYIAKLITFILVLLGIITVLCDFLTTKRISWSIYVVCSIIYLCSHLSFIFHKNIYISLIIELISTELFMFVIAFLNNGIQWCLYLVMPFIFIVWLYVVLCTYLIKTKRKSILKRIAVCLMFGSLALIGIETSIDLYKDNFVFYNWSIYAVLPITIISILIFMLSYNRKLIEEIKQRIFF